MKDFLHSLVMVIFWMSKKMKIFFSSANLTCGWIVILIEINFPVPDFCMERKYFNILKRNSLHIASVYQSLTESESGRAPWVFLLQCFCYLVIVIHETKCPQSLL